MDLTIVEERPNPLLKRTQYLFRIDHAMQATPKRAEVRQALAHAAKVPLERLVVEEMHARFGQARSEGVAFYYQTPEALTALAREHILVRNGLKEKAVKAATPAEPAPKPAEKPESKTEKAEPKSEKPEHKPEKPESKIEKSEPKSEKPEHKPEKSESKAEKSEPKAGKAAAEPSKKE